MDNIYLFIIWHNALWCKKRILNDLRSSFDIVLETYIHWDKDKFPDNLKAFYGTKIPNTKSKISIIGDKDFLVLIVKDNNPKFDLRKTYFGLEKVNINVYDKKDMYRDWTARDFRIHCSCSEIETKHDLTVLFGSNYEDFIKKNKDSKSISINTKGIEGFKSIEELSNNIDSLNNSKVVCSNNSLIVFTKCKIDVLRFLGLKDSIEENDFSLVINDKKYMLEIYGEDEGDLPSEFIECIDDATINQFLYIKDEYKKYLHDKKDSEIIHNFLCDRELVRKNTIRDDVKYSFLERIKKKIKYVLARIKNIKYK